MKKTLFVAGLVSGVVLANWWRSLAKGGIRLGLQAGQRLSEFSQQVREGMRDADAAATQETSRQEQDPGAGE